MKSSISALKQPHYRVCNYCEAMCGVEVSLKANAKSISEDNIRILPDKNDPFSKGSMCPKAAALTPLYFDPEKLQYPVKRVRNNGSTRDTCDEWQQITWDEAYSTVIDSIKAIQQKYGQDAIASYLGNPIVHNLGMLLFVKSFTKAIGSKNVFSATSMDQLPHHFAAHYMFGHEFRIPVPDVDRTDFMIIMGANPLASNGSMMTSAGITKRLRDITERGGKFIVIDPRKTETATIATEHYFIHPSTDLYFLLAFLAIIFRDKKTNVIHLKKHLAGFDQLEELVSDFSNEFAPEKVSTITGIAATTIERLADEYLSYSKAVLYGRMGLSTQLHGGLCHWLINTINVVSGHLDTEGGMMFPSPAIDLARGKNQQHTFGRWTSRVRGMKEFAGELPVSTMTDELLTEGKGQVKAFISICGNPVLSSPSGDRLDKALENIEFMVSIDNYINETTRHANIILPTPSGLEIDHYDLIFNVISVSNNAKFSEALFPPKKDRPYDWQVLKTLTQGLSSKGLSWFDHFTTPRRVINWGLMLGPYGKLSHPRRWFTGLSLKKVIQSKHGINLGPLEPRIPHGLKTADKKIQLVPDVFLQRLAQVRQTEFPNLLNEMTTLKKKYPFNVIGRRHVSTNNSWMHQVKKLSRSKQVRCTAMINPTDAKHFLISDGDIIEVTSRVGTIQLPAELTSTIMSSVISIPHGFGHNKKNTRISHAEAKPGVSLNDITDPQRVDELTGNAAFSGLPVSIRKVAENPKSIKVNQVVSNGKPLLILYGSQSGNAEIIAIELAQAAKQYNLLAVAVKMNAMDLPLLTKIERLLIITSTFGEGDMPDNAENLWQLINTDEAPDLSHLHYAVLALGDSDYANFCRAGKSWNRRLSDLNAQATQEIILCDADYVDQAEQWKASILPLIAATGNQKSLALDEITKEIPLFNTKHIAGTYNRLNPMQATLLRKTLLNNIGSSKKTYHFEFLLQDKKTSYEVGDTFYIFPKNNNDLIKNLLDTCALKKSDKLYSLLQNKYEIRTPSKKLLECISKKYPQNSLSNNEYIGDVIDLLTIFPVVENEQKLLALLSPLTPRAYSIASSINKHSGQVHLIVAKVAYRHKGREYLGTSSGYLADMLDIDETVDSYFSANKYFSIPNNNDAPIIMIGPGTGIAPFRGFLEEREFLKAKGNNWLFFGDRQAEYDFLYEEELLGFQRRGILTRLDTAFSRDQKEKYYVQDAMLAQAASLFQWLEQGAFVFVCGDASRMAKDVDAALHEIVKEHGKLSDIEATAYIQELTQKKRYVRDVY